MTITEAATRYIRLRDVERDLRHRRGACVCANVPGPQDDGGMPAALHPDGKPWEEKECWKFIYDDEGTPGRYGDGSSRGWCGPCERRAKLHAELVVATRKRAGALASLRAAVRASEVPDAR